MAMLNYGAGADTDTETRESGNGGGLGAAPLTPGEAAGQRAAAIAQADARWPEAFPPHEAGPVGALALADDAGAGELQIRQQAEALVAKFDDAVAASQSVVEIANSIDEAEAATVIMLAVKQDWAAIEIGANKLRLEAKLVQQMPATPQGDRRSSEFQLRQGATEKPPYSPEKMRDMRKAHNAVTDEQREAVIDAAREAGEVPTRAALTRAGKRDSSDKPHQSQATGNEEWYTPAEYIAMAKAVMGAIELDPASCREANAVVGAKHIYTQAHDGLEQPWGGWPGSGTLFINPPFSRGVIERFAEKLLSELAAGRVRRAVWLSNNSTETGWFQQLFARCDAMFLPNSRVKFWGKNGVGAALQGQVVFYFGPRAEKFAKECAKLGGGVACRMEVN